MVLLLTYYLGLVRCPQFILRWLTRLGYILTSFTMLVTALAILIPLIP